MSSLWQNSDVFIFFFYFQFTSYIIEMIMLINLECTLAQTRMWFGKVTLPSKGFMRGQYVFVMAKSQSFFYRLSIFN